MRNWLISLLVISCCLLRASIATAQGDPVSEVIYLVNELRLSYGLPAYKVDAALMSAAQAQASWSAANNHIGHDGPGGSSPDDRAHAAGYGGGEHSFAIENAAHGTIDYYNTPDLVVTMWQSDWGHLNAMISPAYEHIGVGYAEAGGYSWYVMMVGWVGSKAGSGETNPPVSEYSVPLSPFILSEPDEQGAHHEGREHRLGDGPRAGLDAAVARGPQGIAGPLAGHSLDRSKRRLLRGVLNRHAWAPRSSKETFPLSSANAGSKRRSGFLG